LAATNNGTPAGTRFNVADLDPSEALVFWLGMLKNDPRMPLNGTSAPVPLFPFDEKRLVDLDGDGWLSYLPPGEKEMPYVYFDSRTYEVSPGVPAGFYDTTVTPAVPLVFPYKTSTKPSDGAPAWKFANATTYQIISAGLDDDFGAVAPGPPALYKRFPFGDNYQLGDMDNISNFSDGKIFEDHME